MWSLEEIAKEVTSFGLTHNQAKVYIATAQLRIASISQVSKASKVRREDVYRMLPKLEKMGLIERILSRPIKIKATPIKDVLSILIKREQDIANEKISTLIAKKDTLLKHFQANRMEIVFEEEKSHFALISQSKGIINKALVMLKNVHREIDIITSTDKFIQIFTDYVELFKEAIKKGAKVRIVLYMTGHEDSILGIIKQNKLPSSLHLKLTDQPSSHYMIVDNKEALIATSTEQPVAENPYLWTDDNNLVRILQKNFEDLWYTAVNLETIKTDTIAEKARQFVRQLRPTNHVLFLYECSEAKYYILFSYLQVGLENDEAVVYIATEENTHQIRDAMKRFGIEVEKHEKTGALRILRCNDIYIIEGKFNIPTTMGLLNKMYNEALTKGFKGWRVAGEMACFFEHNLVQELIEYERVGHRVFDIPIIGICAYNANMLSKADNPSYLYTKLLQAHGTVLFAGVDDKLGKIEIRK